MNEVFALLDDRNASAERPRSRLYRGFVREHRCTDPATLDETWAQVEADQASGLHALLLADYEWGSRLLGAGAPRPGAEAAALRVLMFDRCRACSRDDVDTWLAEQAAALGGAGVMDVRPGVDRAGFGAALERIAAALRAGETYQVNYTYRLDGRAWGEPLALYRRLRERQPVAYGAFVALPPGGESTHVLSCSPELFLRHEDGLLMARPMKGTAPRLPAPESDSETARHLSLDAKNRAENLMIVDLLRNDLGRVAQTGSVQVPGLFDVEPYRTVFQMTSTVQARPRPDVRFPALLRAMFPCGSITGAPKHHTMELIRELESTPRGLYCGAIGWVDAPRAGAPLGDFCLSVAIRTLTLGPERQGARAATLGVGAGIVLDSRIDDEWSECRLKARFLTGLDPGFELFETMYASADAGVRHLERHLARLAASAASLGFAFDREAARERLKAQAAGLEGPQPVRLRLALSHAGGLSVTATALVALPPKPVSLLIADTRLPDANPLAAHKTTLRAAYDEGVRRAEQAGAFDSLFFTADGRLAEGGRSNVFVCLGGRWHTPPVADGALPGVMRGVLLDNPAFGADERSLTMADLLRAEAVIVCNALRGALPARLSVAQEQAVA